MRSFSIKNKRILNLLDEYQKFVMSSDPSSMKLIDDDVADYWVSEKYMRHIIRMGRDHIGSPESAKSYPLKSDWHEDNPDYQKEFDRISNSLREELSVQSNALSQCYPPNGYIAWHNNANAPGYNLIFSWSETGDGWFKYVNQGGDVITMKDSKGWTLKAGYFASYDEVRKPCYHAAYTNCWRITQSYVVSPNREWWEDCLEYIREDI